MFKEKITNYKGIRDSQYPLRGFSGIKSMKHFLYNKKAQLGIIEFKFAFIGLILGIILTLVVVYMANKGILIPFKLGFVCPA